jgi:general secretion pathway protein I
MKRDCFSFGKTGFTLLEIMLSLAIIGGLLVTVLYTLNYHLGIAGKQEFVTVATLLSKSKLHEAEQNPVNAEGRFPEPYSDYSYTTVISGSPYPGLLEVKVTVFRWNSDVSMSQLLEHKANNNKSSDFAKE